MYICIYIYIYVLYGCAKTENTWLQLLPSLVCPINVPQVFVSPENRMSPDLFTMSILKNVKRCSVTMIFLTCLKRRAPENHGFGRY